MKNIFNAATRKLMFNQGIECSLKSFLHCLESNLQLHLHPSPPLHSRVSLEFPQQNTTSKPRMILNIVFSPCERHSSFSRTRSHQTWEDFVLCKLCGFFQFTYLWNPPEAGKWTWNPSYITQIDTLIGARANPQTNLLYWEDIHIYLWMASLLTSDLISNNWSRSVLNTSIHPLHLFSPTKQKLF